MRKLPGLFLFVVVTFAANAQQLALKPVISGQSSPTSLTHAGDSRLFITRQIGLITIWDGTNVLATPFLDVRSLVSCCGERGLLGLAFHPRYRENGFFFVDYTDVIGDTVVARYKVSASDPNRADPTSALVLLRVDQPFANHNGGQLAFGPDGYLYIALGDGGNAGDPQNNAQNLNSLLGKILRIDVDGGSPYRVPSSNPFVGRTGARPEIWAYGLRNPWRFSFDRETGDLWIADVGQGAEEEIDFQPVTSIGGENYGWRVAEGTRCYNASTCNRQGFTDPVASYTHADGCSVTGGYRYRGSRYPRMRATFFYGDYCSGQIWGTRDAGNGTWTSQKMLKTSVSITTFGEDFSGELYVAGEDGQIYTLIDALPAAQKRRAVGAR